MARRAKGDRDRYHGFALGASERDRVVAAWIDAQPNAGEAIKIMIYAAATGQGLMIAGATVDAQADDRPPERDDPRVVALLGALET